MVENDTGTAQDTWLFWCGGMHIVQGIKQKATNGFMGINAAHELVLLDNKGNEFVHAPIGEVEAKLKTWNGDTIKVGGTKYRLNFVPLGRAALGSSFGLIGALVSNTLSKPKEDPRTPEQKRDEFAEVVYRLQGA